MLLVVPLPQPFTHFCQLGLDTFQFKVAALLPGDELVVQISGAMDFVLQLPEGESTVPLRGRAAVIVPRGVWHTARVLEPSEAIFVTRGDGTQHRALGRASI